MADKTAIPRFIMSLKDQMADDAANAFLNTNEFAENISYTPKGGAAKVIKAVVERKHLLPDGETDRTFQNQASIFIANDATDGVTSINKGGDTVSLPVRVGEVSKTCTVVDILDQDNGMWHLLVQL